MKLRLPLALALSLITLISVQANSLVITTGDYNESSILDGASSGYTELSWGTSDTPFSGTVSEVSGFNAGDGVTINAGSTLTVKDIYNNFTTNVKGALLIQGATFFTNDLYSGEKGTQLTFSDNASATINYLAFGGKMLIDNSTLELGKADATTVDSSIGGLPEADTTITIQNNGSLTAHKGIAIGHRSDSSVTKNATIVVKTGGTLTVEKNALRVGAGRTTSDGTSGAGTLIIDGGIVNAEQLYVGDIQSNTATAGVVKTYNTTSSFKGQVSVSNNGELNLTTGPEGNRVVFGKDSLLSLSSGGKFVSSGDTAGGFKWFVAENGAQISLTDAGTSWVHMYQVGLNEGSTLQVLNGASVEAYYLAYGSYEGLIQGTSSAQSTVTIGTPPTGRQAIDSAFGGTSKDGKNTTLTIGEYGKLIAVNGLSLGHRSDSSVSKDVILDVLKNGAVEVTNTLRVGAGRSINGDGTSGKGTLNITGGSITADNMIVGDLDAKVVAGQTPGTGIVTLTKGGSLSSTTLTTGAGATISMDSTSSLTLGTFNHNGGSATLGGTNQIQLLNVSNGAQLALLISSTSIDNGYVVNANQVTGLDANSSPTVKFDLTNKGMDLIGKSVDLVRTDNSSIAFNTISVDGTTVPQGTATYDNGTIKLTYTLTNQGQISFANELVTTEKVTPSSEIISEYVGGDVVSSSNDLIFTPTRSTTPITVGHGINVVGKLNLGTETLTQVDTIVSTDNQGLSHVSVKKTPLGNNGLILTVNENASVSGTSEQKGTLGSVNGAPTISDAIITSGVSFSLDNVDFSVDQKLTSNSGSTLSAVNGSTITIGGSQRAYATPELAAIVAQSQMNGTTIELKGNSTLQTLAVPHAKSTVLDINSATISLGESGDSLGGSIIAGSGTTVNIVNSSVSGIGTLSNVHVSKSDITAGHSPGVLTLASGSYAQSVWNAYIVSDNILPGQLNNDTSASGNISQFKIEGVVATDNVTFNILWDGTPDASKLTEGTDFQLLDLTEGSIDGVLIQGSLPELSADLVWDISRLSSVGIASITSVELGEGRRIANTMWSAGDTVSSFSSTALNHVHDFRTKDNNVWVSGLGGFANVNNHNGRAGYDYDGGGYAVGFDKSFRNNLTLGAAFGQSFGQHKPNQATDKYSAGKIDQDGIMGALYGKQILSNPTPKDSVWLEGYVAYGVIDNDSTKDSLYNSTLAPAKASWDDQVWNAGLKAVWRKELCPCSAIIPFIGIDYTHVDQDDFTETMGSKSARYVGGSYQAWTVSAGATYELIYNYANGMALRPSITAAYLGDVSRNTPSVEVINGTNAIKEYGVNPGRTGLFAAFNLGWKINSSWGANTGYQLETRSGMTTQSAYLGVNYAF